MGTESYSLKETVCIKHVEACQKVYESLDSLCGSTWSQNSDTTSTDSALICYLSVFVHRGEGGTADT
jgi:hypothetical protein